MYYVYKYTDRNTNECLYIGKTTNIYRRHVSHLSSKKEEWCRTDLKLEYIELPDKYNMDFYEIYLINKLLPKYNISTKNSMVTDFINFNYPNIWIEYSKELFLNEFKLKNEWYGIKIDFNEENIKLLQILLKYNRDIKIKFESGILTYDFYIKNIDIYNYISKLNVITFNYKCIGISGGGHAISLDTTKQTIEDNEFIYRVAYNFHLRFLKDVQNNLIDERDMSEIDRLNDYILKMLGIYMPWEELYNELVKNQEDIIAKLLTKI